MLRLKLITTDILARHVEKGMTQSIYITGAEPQSGKSVVLLGLMEWLSNQARTVGFFRPVIQSEEEPDRLIHLILSRYGSRFPYFTMYGCTYEQTIEDREKSYKLILDKYKALEEQCEILICVGTGFGGASFPVELRFNAEIAYNLGSPVVVVINGIGRTSRQIVDFTKVAMDTLEQQKCDILTIIINRVDHRQITEVAEELRRALPATLPSYVIPEHPILDKLTVGEVARSLNVEYLQGDKDSLSHTVNKFKVAAMELPHLLDRIEEGDLIITPGDRADIILGSLAVEASRSYPHIAGLLLTGGFKPAPQVQRLIQGLGRLPIPILSVTTDTYTTAAKVSSLKSSLVPEDQRKITVALGIFEASVRFDTLQRSLTLPRSRHVTPLMFEYELIQRARSTRRHIVLPEGSDERILRAVEILLLRDVVDITLLGDPERLRPRIGLLGIKVEGVNIVNPLDSPLRETFAQTYYELRKHKGISRGMAFDAVADNTYFGTLMVHHGHADGMVSGAIHTTSNTIRPAFEIIRSRPGFSIVSSVFFMCLADRVLVFGDCAVNADPNPDQLADIAISSAETAQMFGIEPYVAMLSYSTGESGKGVDVDKVREGTLIAKRRRPDLKIEGPIQYDAAIDLEVARTKLPGSEVAGNATVFIFPDLNAGNTTYKAVQRSANAVAIGPILQGLNKPVNDLSRGCTVTDIVNTVAITAIQAQTMQEPK